MTWLIEEMLKKFEHSPDIGKLLVTNLEVLLQADMRAEAKEFMEYCITGVVQNFLSSHISKGIDITPDKKGIHIFFLFPHKDICCGYF